MKALTITALVGFLCLTFFSFSFAATIKGHITDAETNEQLIGANIHIKELNISTATNLEGEYEFHSISPGTYTLQCFFIGSQDTSVVVKVSSDDEIVRVNIAMATLTILNEVVVAGHSDRESNQNARETEQKADNVINIIPAQAIALLPDITIANTLQRISGVTIERNSTGDGKYPIIRGMDKRYSYTTIDGIKIPSPDDNGGRYIPLDLFPSDFVEKVEVEKTLLPSMEGDAIGGAVNLKLRDAPDYLLIRANISGGIGQMFLTRAYSQFDASVINLQDPNQLHGNNFTYNAQTSSSSNPNFGSSPDFPSKNLEFYNLAAPLNGTANVIVGNRFFNKKLGVIATGSFQNLYRGSNEFVALPASQPYANNLPAFDDIEARQYSTEQKRYAAQAKIDYEFNKFNSIDFYTIYVQTIAQESRFIADTTVPNTFRKQPGQGNVDLDSMSRINIQSIYNSTLQGRHVIFPGFKMDWSLVYAVAKNNTPDWAEFNNSEVVVNHKVIDTPGVKSLSMKWINSTETDKSAYLNLQYDLRDNLECDAGAMFRDKFRDNYYNSYSPSVVESKAGTNQIFTNVNDMQFNWIDATATGDPGNDNTYTVREDVWAAYFQAKYTLKVFAKDLQILAGIRYENTTTSYAETLLDPTKVPEATGNSNYGNALPGIHFKYKLNKKQNLRFSAYQSMTRPSLFEITPYKISGEYFDELGNPLLLATTANNYDFRYELFPKGIDQILLGVFYKTIYDPIEYAFVRQFGKPSAQEISPVNDTLHPATNYGFEAVFTKYVGNFGISLNYTYTNSSITIPKQYFYTNSKGIFTSKDSSETSPLQGQSAHIGNVSFIYKNTKKGIDAQIALVYTGRHIVINSPDFGLDYWQKSTIQLDLSAEKTIGKHFSAFVKATNLLNTPVVIQIMQSSAPFRPGNSQSVAAYELPNQTDNNAITTQIAYYLPTYLIGARYKF